MLHGRPDLRRRPRHDVRRLPRARRPDLRLLAERRHGLPRRRRARAGRAARGVLLRRPARAERMPLAGLVVNRIGRVAAPGLSPPRALAAAESLEDGGGRRRRRTPPACCGCTPRWSETAERQRELAERFSRAHPGIPVVQVPALRTRRPRPRRAPGGRAAHWRGRESRPRRCGQRSSPCELLAASPSRKADFHEVMSGRLRSRARRSRSVMPPQTPNSVRLSRASARHCARTGHVLQTAFASCCALPRTKSASGSCLGTGPASPLVHPRSHH